MKFFTSAGIQLPAYFLSLFQRVTPVLMLAQGTKGNIKIRSKCGFGWILFITAFMLPAFAAAQVTGTVTDDKGEPLADVSVQVQGKAEGVTTGKEGRYSI